MINTTNRKSDSGLELGTCGNCASSTGQRCHLCTCLPRSTVGNGSPGELASDTWEPGCLPSLSPPIFLLLPSCDLFQHSHLWPGTQPSQICYTDLLTPPQVPTRLKTSGSHAVVWEGDPDPCLIVTSVRERVCSRARLHIQGKWLSTSGACISLSIRCLFM